MSWTKRILIPALATGALVLAAVVVDAAGPEQAKPPRAVVVGSDRVQVCPFAAGNFVVSAGATNSKVSITDLGEESVIEPAPASKTVEDKPMILTDVAGIPAVGGSSQSGAMAWWGGCQMTVSEAYVQFPEASTADIIVVNPSNRETSVGVSMYGVDGEIVAQGSTGIRVAPRSSRTIPISVLAPDPSPIGVKVVVDQGGVAVFGRSRQMIGRDFVPTTLVGTENVIPGIQTGTTASSVLITNPNPDTAQIEVNLLGTSGRFVPVGGEQVAVPAYSTVAIDLTTGVAGGAVGVEVNATLPVATTMTASANSDTAFSSAIKPSIASQQWAWADGSLVLSNPQEKGQMVTVTMGEASQKHQLPRGHTVVVPIIGDQLISVTGETPLVASINVSEAGYTIGALEGLPEAEGGIPVVLDPGLR